MLKHFIDRPIAVTMVLGSILVVGVVCALRLPVSLLPDVDIPYITVQVDAPQMSARELDAAVVRPLRNQFRQIDGIAGLQGEAKDGSARLKLSFSHADNLDYRFIEVNEKLDRAMGSLPDISRPKVMKASATDLPAFYLNLTARNGDFLALSRFARDVIVKRLEQLDAVSMVDASGYEEAEILIVPDAARMAQCGITPSQLESLLRSADIRLGSLTIRDGQYRYGVRFQSNVADVGEIRDLWINHDGQLLQLGEIASVEEVPAPRAGMLTSDGQPAVSLAVIKQSDARMSDLRRSVTALMETMRTDYPDVEFTLTRDQTALLDYSIGNLIQSIIIGILLACLAIFLFMRDFRSPALVAVTIPVSLVFAMLVFRLAGMSLNIISLSGLLLGVGMMTDNTLILVDNITGRWQRGDSLRASVLAGTREVTAPMLSAILTTCAVFIPLVSINGLAGALFRDQALAVTIVLFTSWLVTITAVPVYYFCWYRRQTAFRPHPLLERIAFTQALERWDGRVNSWMLHHRGVAWALVGLSAIGAVLGFLFIPKATLPHLTRTDTLLRIDWNESLSPEEGIRRLALLEDEAAPLHRTAMAGVQQFVLDHDGDLGSGEGMLYLAYDREQDLTDAQARLETSIHRQWPSAGFAFSPADNIFDLAFGSREAPLTARLHSTVSEEADVASLRTCLAAIREAMPGTAIPAIPVKEQIVFTADPERMALSGVGYPALLSSLRSALRSNRVLTLVQGDRSVPVLISTDPQSLSRILESTTVRAGQTDIPLSALMRQGTAEDLKSLFSGPEGSYYPVAFDIDYRDVPAAMEAVRGAVARDGRFEAGFSGSWFSTRDMIRDLLLTFLIAIVLLYLILAAQFESLLQPVIILLEVVIDACVAIGVLWLCGETLNLMSMIGLVVITGIVINDSILKIDTINRLRQEGMSTDEAILTAGQRRLKAIIMTSLTTILAVCPFLWRGNLGADLQFPLSLVIVAGMTAGTLVSLFVVPALYRSITRS